MICQQLATLTSSDARGIRGAHVNSFDQRALHHGSTMHELKCLSDLSPFELDWLHRGKEASIGHMLAGGNGFASSHHYNQVAAVPFDSGMTIERRDLRSMLIWSRDLEQCKRDGATRSAHR